PEGQMATAGNSDAQAKIKDLEEELRLKESQINNLKAELQSKDALIDDLSAQANAQPVQNYSGNVGNVTESEYEMTYQEGRNAFENRNYEAAIQYFEALLATSTTNSLSDNAQYWIGECHFALKQYDAAIIDFEKVMTFPNSNKNVDAQFKLGLCYLRKGSTAKAVEEFERLNADYPGNRFQQRVNQILAQL
ncbi:MAG: tetratricopeptide repeat protein, partial [Calditrichaceae bacterium]